MSYLDLLNIKYKFKEFLILTIIIFIGICIYILNLEIYDTNITYGYKEKGFIVAKISIDNPDIINSIAYIKVGDKKYKVLVNSVGEISLDKENLINYQDVYLKVDNELRENQVFKLTIMYNKEKVYEKLKKLLF